MNKAANRPFGSIMKFMETNKDSLSLTFKSEIFLHGGEMTGFACPDNMCFDPKGNIWMTTDVADYDLNKDEYKSFGNNGLFYIPMSGPDAGKAFRFAIAPTEAEFTGPCFSRDGKTLFLSVQHPGANTKDLKNPTSHWPDGGKSLPKSAVVTISGPLLDSLM
jgi:secreted PhoX family phosphatase